MRSELIGGYSYWQTSKKLRNLSLVLLANERSLLSVHQVQTGQGSGQPVNVVLTIWRNQRSSDSVRGNWMGRTRINLLHVSSRAMGVLSSDKQNFFTIRQPACP